MSAQKSTGQAALLLGLVILLWGVNWPIIKVGIQHMPPLWFAVARIFLAALGGCVGLGAGLGRAAVANAARLAGPGAAGVAVLATAAVDAAEPAG